MSSVSLQDLIKKGYNIVSIDARNVKVSDSLPTSDSESRSQDEEKQVALLDKYGNIIEPSASRSKRAFLLLSEIGNSQVVKRGSLGLKSLTSKKVMKGKKGKSAGKAIGKNKEEGRVYGPGEGLPSMGGGIAANKAFKVNQQLFISQFLQTSASIPVFYARYFSSADIDQFTYFSAVFDQYRFSCIELWISPEAGLATGSTSNYASVIDYDDTNALTLYAQALDYGNCVQSNNKDTHYHKFVPHCAVAAFSGSFTSYVNVVAPWIDCNSTSVQHYGLKVAAYTSNVTQTFDLTVRIHAEFRNVR